MTMIDSDILDDIDDVVDNFDFERVHTVMFALDWHWEMGADARIPNVSELRREARRIVKTAVKLAIEHGTQYIVQTGGFYARVDLEGSKACIRLSFEVESQDNYE